MSTSKLILLLVFGLSLGGALQPADLLAQAKEEKITLTKAQIMEGAKKEGKLNVSPGFDDSAIPTIVKAFEKKYPFIKVSASIAEGIPALQRQLFDMSAGRANLDVYNANISFWSEYFKQNVIKKYDFKAMARAGQLNIPLEMIDDTGMVVWLGTNTGVLVYNTKLISPDKAPKGWDACVDSEWKGKFSVDTKPNVFAWLVTTWGDDKLLSFARKVKENGALWGRGNQRLVALAQGETQMLCGNYIHSTQRMIRNDPSTPIKMVVPNPFPMSFHEPEAIYTGAKNPHAALLWIEYLASKEGQEVTESIEPGRGSFLVEGTMAYKMAKGVNVSLCGADCRDKEDKLMHRIATEAWGFPKVGYEPKK
jgi:iron(III) transport system substrate-binding protein